MEGDIQNLTKTVENLVDDKSKLEEKIENLTKTVENIDGYKTKFIGEIENLTKKVDNLADDYSKLKKEIDELKVDNGRLGIKIESLNKVIIEQDKIKDSIIKDRDEQKKKNENFEKINKEMSEKFKMFENQIIGIQNRENYKSIIYILLIFFWE